VVEYVATEDAQVGGGRIGESGEPALEARSAAVIAGEFQRRHHLHVRTVAAHSLQRYAGGRRMWLELQLAQQIGAEDGAIRACIDQEMLDVKRSIGRPNLDPHDGPDHSIMAQQPLADDTHRCEVLAQQARTD
jgi:hypothetical protein